MRDEELVLRFFAFHIHGIESYRTPQKFWLNETAKSGSHYPATRIQELKEVWQSAVDVSLIWFESKECYRRIPVLGAKAINRALFDLTMRSATQVDADKAHAIRSEVRSRYTELLHNAEFNDLVSRAVDHTKRNRRRFAMWDESVGAVVG
jgi:hypothetical protein